MTRGIERAFPKLLDAQWRVTSDSNDIYNCVAWAVESTSQWWWPEGAGKTHWPEGVPRAPTLDAFRSAFGTLGYVECTGEELEAGFRKIALFVKDSGVPTHAARQLESGRWTSKLGKMEDIEHDLHALEGQ